MARRTTRLLLFAVAAACALTCASARARATLAAESDDAHARAHGALSAAPAGAALASATQAGPVEQLAPGIFRASYRLPLRPLSPGEVLYTQAGNTLLGHPPGRVALLDWQFELLGSNGRPAPLSALYNHHFVVMSSAGVPVAEVAAGAEWPARLTRNLERYASLSARNVSFNAGPCEYTRYIYGGGAEWRGVQRDQAFDAIRPGAFPPAAAWLTGEEEAVWGLNLHAIDLRNVSNVRDCVQCACAYYAQHNAGAGREAASQAPQPGGGVQCCPDKARCDAGGADALEAYTFQYNITFANDTRILSATKPLLRSVLTVESFTASNGYTCGVEYNPSTCGATPAEPPGAWAAESTCGTDDKSKERVSRLAFNWTVPNDTDIELRYAVGHQHIGGRGIALLATPPGARNATLVCDSRPEYEPAGTAARGFVSSMSACDMRERPLRLARGTVLRVVSTYHADKAPLPEAVFQLPWQGTMGYMNLEYTIADGSAFAVITATGAQEMPQATNRHGVPVSSSPGGKAPVPGVAQGGTLAAVCLAHALPQGAQLLKATNITSKGGATAGAAAPKSIVLTRTPVLYTMDWDIDAARGVVRITLAVNTTGFWFGVGLHSPGSAQGGMIDGDMVIVQKAVDDGAAPAGASLEIAEYYAEAYARPTRKTDVGGGSGLSGCGAEAAPQGSGVRISFERPLRGAAGGRSADVVPGARASVAWALGAGPRLAQHRAAGRVAVDW